MCLYPKKAVRLNLVDDFGEQVSKLVFCKNEESRSMFVSNLLLPYTCLDLPCGKCVECLQQKSTEWSYRIILESSLYEKNCFCTLTYSKTTGELFKSDFQKFMKRLRKFLQLTKIRFFACGEYGSKGRRPHFHCIIFGWQPNDLVIFNKKEKLYGSQILEKIWTHGFVSVSPLTLETAKYCAKYLQKLNKLKDKKQQPFLLMSLKPGLGLSAFLQKKDSYLPTDKIYIDGHYVKIPRYFLDKLKKEANVEDLQKIEVNRLNRLIKGDIMKKTEEELVLLRKKKERILKHEI